MSVRETHHPSKVTLSRPIRRENEDLWAHNQGKSTYLLPNHQEQLMDPRVSLLDKDGDEIWWPMVGRP